MSKRVWKSIKDFGLVRWDAFSSHDKIELRKFYHDWETFREPTVSICIPSHNRPEYLRVALESCVAQTFQDFEVIVSDNSEPKKRNEIEEAISRTLPATKLVFCEGGSLENHTRAVSLARGKYIKILADDDCLNVRHLDKMVTAFEQYPRVGIVTAPMTFIDAEGKETKPRLHGVGRKTLRYCYGSKNSYLPANNMVRDFLTGGDRGDYPCCVPSGLMYRAEAFKECVLPFDPNADFAGDVLSCLKVAMAGWDFYYINEPLSAWRILEDNHTSRLHRTGFSAKPFYYILDVARDICPWVKRDEKLIARALFFCECRALGLNLLAAWKCRDINIFRRSVREVCLDGIAPLRFWLWLFAKAAADL